MFKAKKILAAVGAVASVIFMTTMLLWTDDARPVDSLTVADAGEKALAKSEDGKGLLGNSLSGTVTIDGLASMPHGTVIVYGSASPEPIGCAAIQPEGGYLVRDLPTGVVQLVVTTRSLNLDHAPKIPHHPKIRPPSGPVAANRPNSRTASVATNLSMPRRMGQKNPLEISRRNDAETMASSILEYEEKCSASRIFARVDQLYGSLSAPKKITTKINEHENTFNIDLDTHTSADAVNP